MSAGFAHLVLDVRAPVLWVRIDRPQRRNALSRATLEELGRVFRGFAHDLTLKAAVITGTGTEAFAAGGDVKEFTAIRTAEQAAALFDEASTALDAIRCFPVPTLAALNGAALGGGAELALACDFRVAVPQARIGCVHARLAISTGFGGSADLIRLLGVSRALRHGLAGEALSAGDALAMGLIDEVADEGVPLEEHVGRMLGPILRPPPQTIRAWKAIALAARAGTAAELRAVERQCFAATWTDPEHWAAVERAFKRREERST